MSVTLRIGRLVLEGVETSDVERVRVAIEQALAARLVAEPSWLASGYGGGRLTLPGGTFRVDHGASPETIGEMVASQLLAAVSESSAGGGKEEN